MTSSLLFLNLSKYSRTSFYTSCEVGLVFKYLVRSEHQFVLLYPWFILIFVIIRLQLMNETLFEIFKWTKSSYIICAESAEYALKSAALVCFVKQFILSIKRLKFLNQ